jgi:hypothetical protein
MRIAESSAASMSKGDTSAARSTRVVATSVTGIPPRSHDPCMWPGKPMDDHRDRRQLPRHRYLYDLVIHAVESPQSRGRSMGCSGMRPGPETRCHKRLVLGGRGSVDRMDTWVDAPPSPGPQSPADLIFTELRGQGLRCTDESVLGFGYFHTPSVRVHP